jgi:two-component system cell cycle response regulator
MERHVHHRGDGVSNQDAKNQALNAGADDYLLKPYDIEELTARLRNGMRISKLQERLRHAALTDSLTGLWNHAEFRELIGSASSPARGAMAATSRC